MFSPRVCVFYIQPSTLTPQVWSPTGERAEGGQGGGKRKELLSKPTESLEQARAREQGEGRPVPVSCPCLAVKNRPSFPPTSPAVDPCDGDNGASPGRSTFIHAVQSWQ